MAKSEERKLNPLNIKGILEVLSAIAIGSAVFGFLVVNTNLAAYGLWDFNFLSADYISAGVLFLVFLFITVAPMVLAYDKILDLRAHRADPKTSAVKKFFIKPFEWIIGVCSLIPVGFFLFFAVPIADGGIKTVFVITITILTAFSVLPAISIAYSYYQEMFLEPKSVSRPSVKEITRKWLISFKPFYILLVLLVLVLIFGVAIYPFIPHAFGGGRPIFVQINFADNSFDTTSTIATLIYETSNSVIFNTTNGTYSMSPDKISSIQYLESVPSFRNDLPILMYGTLSSHQ